MIDIVAIVFGGMALTLFCLRLVAAIRERLRIRRMEAEFARAVRENLRRSVSLETQLFDRNIEQKQCFLTFCKARWPSILDTNHESSGESPKYTMTYKSHLVPIPKVALADPLKQPEPPPDPAPSFAEFHAHLIKSVEKLLFGDPLIGTPTPLDPSVLSQVKTPPISPAPAPPPLDPPEWLVAAVFGRRRPFWACHGPRRKLN